MRMPRVDFADADAFHRSPSLNRLQVGFGFHRRFIAESHLERGPSRPN